MKTTTNILIVILSVGLLAYSAYRAFDFVSATMPADQQIIAFMYLFATEFGIVIWLVYNMFGAQGASQRGISLTMVIVDTVGSFTLYTADTFLRTGQSGTTFALTETQMQMVIVAMSVLVLMNVASGIACHLTDPNIQRRAAEQRANDSIHRATYEEINRNAPALAKTIAPRLAQNWADKTHEAFVKNDIMGFGRPKDYVPEEQRPLANRQTDDGQYAQPAQQYHPPTRADLPQEPTYERPAPRQQHFLQNKGSGKPPETHDQRVERLRQEQRKHNQRK